MVDSSEDPLIDQGAALQNLLELHRDFVERCYSLLLYVQEQLERLHDYRLMQWIGAARNGTGSGLRSSEWIQSYVGLPFVARSANTARKQTSVVTPVPEDGLRVLLIQIRWLEKAGGKPPVVWAASILANVEPYQPTEFEPYYFNVFSKLEAAEQAASGETARKIQEFVSRPNRYPTLTVTGVYTEVPLVSLRSEQDVQELLIGPALQLARAQI